MLFDVWDLRAVDALNDELDFRIRAGNVAETRLCAVVNRQELEHIFNPHCVAAARLTPNLEEWTKRRTPEDTF